MTKIWPYNRNPVYNNLVRVRQQISLVQRWRWPGSGDEDGKANARDKIDGKGFDFYPFIFRCTPPVPKPPPPPPPQPSHPPPKALQRRSKNHEGSGLPYTCCIDVVVHILDRFRHYPKTTEIYWPYIRNSAKYWPYYQKKRKFRPGPPKNWPNGRKDHISEDHITGTDCIWTVSQSLGWLKMEC